MPRALATVLTLVTTALLGGCARGPGGAPSQPALDHAVADTGKAVATDSGQPPADTGDTGEPVVVDTGEPPDTADTGPVHEGSKALCIVTLAYDYYADGTTNAGYRSQVDERGNLLLKEYLDRDLVASVRVEASYDADDHVLEQLEDYEADGVVDTTRSYTYDAHGNMVARQYDHGGSVSDYLWTHTYDGFDFLVLTTYDGYGDEADGVTDERTVFTNDEAGRPLVEAQDMLDDGTVELTVTRAYDGDGRITAEAWDYDGLTDAWGTPYEDYTWAYTYDAAGNLLSWSEDIGSDGSAMVARYTYDADNHVLTYELDYTDDGVVDVAYAYAYDTSGNLVSTTILLDGAWVPSRAYAYDADGHLVEDQVFRDGVLVYYTRFTYDADGDLVSEIEYLPDGTAEWATYVSYDCG